MEIKFISAENVEKKEIRTMREVIEKAKPIMDKSPNHRAYISFSDIEKLFPSSRVEYRYPESTISQLRKYVKFFNYKYCPNGTYYHLGTVWARNGEQVVYIQEIKREKVPFSVIDEADIDIDDDDDNERINTNSKTLGGVNIQNLDLSKVSEDVKERLENE